jgi:hypothetical protein
MQGFSIRVFFFQLANWMSYPTFAQCIVINGCKGFFLKIHLMVGCSLWLYKCKKGVCIRFDCPFPCKGAE